jgi:PAS domain S-box-containing protein
VLIAMSEKMDLEKYGYNVLTAHSGKESIDMFKSHDGIDLILMDIDLGSGMDGTEAAQVISEEYEVPIIFVSSHTAPEVVEKTEKITSYGYVVKNSSMTVLDASIKMAFRLFHARQTEKEMEEHLNLALEGGELGTWEWNIHTDEMRFNNRWAEMKGYNPDEIEPVLSSWKKLLHPEDVPDIMKKLYSHLEGETPNFETEYRIKSRNDEWLWMLDRGKILERDNENKPLIMCGTNMNITDRKITEEKLRESEKRLSLAMDASKQGYWDWDFKTDSLFVSPHYKEMLGHDKEDSLEWKEIWMDVIHIDDHSKVLPVIVKHVKSGEPYAGEFRLLCNDGSYKWFLIRGDFFEYSGEGVPTRAVGIYIDIDAQKRAELENIKLSQRINAGLRIGNIAWWEMHLPSGNVIFDNQKAEMLGYTNDRFKTYHDFTCLLHPDDYEKAIHAVRNHVDGKAESYDVEYRIKAADGSYKWFHGVGGITEYNHETGDIHLVGIVEDITKRKQNEEHLQVLNIAIENSLDGIAIADMDCRITYANPAALQIWGYNILDEILGRSVYEFWENKEMAENDVQVLFNGENLIAERTAFRTDGARRVIAISSAMVNDHNKRLGIVATFQDITDRKMAEFDLNSALLQKKELLKELQHRAKNSFATIESLLRLKASSLSNNDAKEIIEDVCSRIRAISELYTMLYDSESPLRVNLQEYIHKVLSSLEGLSDRIEITGNISPLESTTKNAVTLGLLITEVVTNSIKHAFPDESAGHVQCTLRKNVTGISMTISDNGIGMPAIKNLEKTDSTGRVLIHSLTRQLGGIVDLKTENGTSYLFSFPEL